MFKTYDHARIPIPCAEAGENVWTYAELIVNKPWFYADCRISDGDSSIGSGFMLTNAAQIRNLIDIEGISIQEVYVVSPPYVNGSDCWQMGPVRKISTGSLGSGDAETIVEIYDLVAGQKYYSSPDIKDGKSIKNLEIIFSSK